MDDEAHPPGRRAALTALLVASLVAVAAVTLDPRGSGWSWGAPAVELRWYVSGLGSAATRVQLLGNLALLTLPAAVAVLRWPSLGRPAVLAGMSLAAGAAIELLQWVLPLGRAISPLDAVLNAGGAAAAGLLVASRRVRDLGSLRAQAPSFPQPGAGPGR
jgi:hypothetical protein